MSRIAIRDHAERHGVNRIDMAAEGAGEHDAVDAIDSEQIHEKLCPGVERALGQLHGAHVGLGHGNFRLTAV